MGLKEKIKKWWMKKKIITVFEKEVSLYSKRLGISEEIILADIRMYLSGRSPFNNDMKRVIEIFNDRVNFYSKLISLPSSVIEEVIEEYLSTLPDR